MNNVYRPNYHFSAPSGWLNDPNGLIYFRGEYHMFYQYHPGNDKDAVGACWGHTVTKDFLTWRNLPIAISPSESYDKNGCWSGTAIEKDGKLYLLYTGYAETPNGVRQTQCLAVSDDGINFSKFEGNPVINSDMIPKDSSKVDFRDPDAFIVGDTTYVLIGSHTNKGIPQVLLYKTKDLIKYEYCGVAAKRKNSGTMWECPNYLDFGEKQGLILSPQWYPRDNNRFTNVSSTVYGIGKFDKKREKFVLSTFEEMDGGCDFYATRCTQLDTKTPIMTSWMQMWARKMIPLELGHGWSGIMGLPRLLLCKGKKIIQKPIPQVYDNLCKSKTIKTSINGEKRLKGVSGRSLHLDIVVDKQEAKTFGIKVFCDSDNYALITFDLEQGLCTFDRRHTLHQLGGHEGEGECSRLGYRTISFGKIKKKLKAEIFLDNSTVEVFINGGVATTTNLVYNDEKSEDIVFFSDAPCTLRVTKSDIILKD